MSAEGRGYGKERRKVLLLGAKKAGKTSCLKTVFEGLNPKDTIWLETTQSITKTDFDSIIPLEFWDTPGTFDLDCITWEEFSTIVYVLDVGQDTHYPISQMVPIFVLAYAYNPSLNFEVFLNKSDGLESDYQDDDLRDISNRVMDEILYFSNFPALVENHPNANFPNGLAEEEPWLDKLITEKLRFWFTSIHNYTIYEAWSRVVQKLMEDIYGDIEAMLGTFGQTSSIHKSFLFDINAKIYVAMDINSVESSTFQLCSDYLSRMLILQSLFDKVPEAKAQARLNGSWSKHSITQNGENGNDVQDSAEAEGEVEDEEEKEWPVNVARLGDNTSICYWQFSKRLALISMISSDTFNEQEGMIEYNVALLRKGILDVLEAIS